MDNTGNFHLLNRRVETNLGRGVIIGRVTDTQVIILHDKDVRLNNPIWCWVYPLSQVIVLPEEAVSP